MGLKIATFTIAAQQATARAYYALQHDWHMVDYANYQHFVECPEDYEHAARDESDEYHNVHGNGYDRWS